MTGETIGDDPGDDDGDTLAGAGEFVVIDRLVAGRAQADTVTLGPGDDAAVVAAPDGRTAVSTDMLVQDRHFRLDWSTPHDIGRKRSPRTPPTSRRWAGGPPHSWWRSVRHQTPRSRQQRNCPRGCGMRRVGWMRASPAETW